LAALAAGQPFVSDARYRRADGEFVWFNSHTEPLRDETGRIVKCYGTHFNIDDRKRAEEALRLSEAYMAHAQQVAGFGSWAYKSSHIGGYPVQSQAATTRRVVPMRIGFEYWAQRLDDGLRLCFRR
jgi:hypothetical protein